MSLIGRASSITIKSDESSDGICKFSDVTLRLTKNASNSKVIIQIPPDNDTVYQFCLKDCTYLEKSSSPGVVDCISNNSTKQTMVILDNKKQCVELLEYIRNCLTGGVQHTLKSDDEQIHNQKVNQLIRALNNSDTNSATQLARQLAGEQISFRFALDMINESGNEPPRQPPEPVIEPLRLRLSIESFLVSHCTNEQYDVAILPQTTIKDLKQIVERDTGITPNHQYWYIDRELLDDNYMFGVTAPRVNESTILTLFIAKPHNN